MSKALLAMLLLLSMQAIHAQSAHRPVIYDIRAEQTSTNKIEVTWKLPDYLTDSYVSAVMLYKDTMPLNDEDRLKELEPIMLPKGSITYIDTVTDYREYYYAVIAVTEEGSEKEELYYDEEQDGSPISDKGRAYTVLLPGVNATVTGARVSYTQKQKTGTEGTSAQKTDRNKGEMRAQPLPYMDVLGDLDRGNGTISAKAFETARTLIPYGAARKEVLEPYIFEEDIMSPQGGDDYLLFEILSSSFIQKDYDTSIKKLQGFLAQHRNESVTRRATFYLGESYYYTGDYPYAISLFLSLDEYYPALVRKWSDSSLDFYQIPDALQ